jgi:glutathione S-transferase
LARNYDKDYKFSFTDPFDVSRAEQWMAWQHGGLGPMQGQANHFNVYMHSMVHRPLGVKADDIVAVCTGAYRIRHATIHGRDRALVWRP